MASIRVHTPPDYGEVKAMMQNDACFDVADGRGTDTACIPDLSAVRGIHGPKAPPTAPKVFLSNDCSFNCAYCGCRAGREEKQRYCIPPRQLAQLAVSEAEAGGRGVFITSAIYKNAEYTQELIIETLRAIRHSLGYTGYVHAKVMPGAAPELIRETGRLANRLSVNIEVAKSEGYQRVARQKSRENILGPMGAIAGQIAAARDPGRHRPPFATSQTTQLMAGSTGESDRVIMTLSAALYKKYGLSRVYYTPFHYRGSAKGYDLEPVAVPVWRMTRLYQADRLMMLYGFKPDEIAPESEPYLAETLDPKAAWALRNLGFFPVEVNSADYEALLRVPGIGVVYARRILEARRHTRVTPEVLGQIGVSLKKSRYFITCGGRYQGGYVYNTPEVMRMLLEAYCSRQEQVLGQLSFL